MPQNTSYITYLPFRKYTQMVPQNTSNLTYLPFQKVDAYLAPPYLFVVCLPLLLSAVLEASSLAECAASRATSGISSSAACSDSDLVLGCADWLGVSAMGAEEDVEVFWLRVARVSGMEKVNVDTSEAGTGGESVKRNVKIVQPTLYSSNKRLFVLWERERERERDGERGRGSAMERETTCTFTYFGVCPWILLSLTYIYIFWGLYLDFAVLMYIYIFWGLYLDFAVPHVHLHILGSVPGFCCPSRTFTYSGVCPWILLSLTYIYIFWAGLGFCCPMQKGLPRNEPHIKNSFLPHNKDHSYLSHTHTYLLESQTEVLAVQTGRLGHLLQKSWSTLRVHHSTWVRLLQFSPALCCCGTFAIPTDTLLVQTISFLGQFNNFSHLPVIGIFLLYHHHCFLHIKAGYGSANFTQNVFCHFFSFFLHLRLFATN